MFQDNVIWHFKSPDPYVFLTLLEESRMSPSFSESEINKSQLTNPSVTNSLDLYNLNTIERCLVQCFSRG